MTGEVSRWPWAWNQQIAWYEEGPFSREPSVPPIRSNTLIFSHESAYTPINSTELTSSAFIWYTKKLIKTISEKKDNPKREKKAHPHRNRLVDWQKWTSGPKDFFHGEWVGGKCLRLSAWCLRFWYLLFWYLRFWYLKLLKNSGFVWKKEEVLLELLTLGMGAQLQTF